MKASSLKRWPAWLLMLGAVVALLLVGTLRDTGPRSESDRIDAITKRIACPVCSGESVFESRNAASVNIRNKVQDLVEQGTQSDDQIISAIQQDSDVQLLLVPKRSGIDALAWALPVAAAVVAFVGLGLAFRRWKRAVDTVPTDADRALVDAARRRDGDVVGTTATSCWPELPTPFPHSEQGLAPDSGGKPSSERENEGS